MATGHQRKDQIDCFCRMGVFFAIIAVGFCVGGIGSLVCLQDKGYEFEGSTDKIFIGSFMLLACSMLYAWSNGRIKDLERKKKQASVYDCVKFQGLLLLCATIGIAFACPFTAIFVSNSGILQGCNSTDTESTNSNSSTTDLCLEDCKPFAIVHIVSLAGFCLLYIFIFFNHVGAQEKVALPVHRPKQKTDGERAKQIEETEGMVFLHFLCMVIFIVIGLVETSCLYQYNNGNFWEKIYIGTFLIAGICMFHVLLTGGIRTSEKEGRRKEVSDKVKHHGCMLVVSVFGIAFAWAFIGVFIQKSDVFQPCDNSTTTPADDFCVYDCNGVVVANICFMAVFVLITFLGFALHSKKAEKLIITDKSIQPATTPKTTNGIRSNDPKNKPKTTSQNEADKPPPKTTSEVSTSNGQPTIVKPKKKTKKLKDVKVNGAEESTTCPTKDTVSKPGSSKMAYNSFSDIPVYYNVSYTNESANFGKDELYNNQHISETPPPLVFVVDRDSTMLARRLPPLPRYKSFAAEPVVEPPRYEDVVHETGQDSDGKSK